jgi:broad specificity phosphatase PhoE
MLILVRHGQTAPNAEGRLLGRGDPPLTPQGLEQAAALAKLPFVAGAARVVSSPLTRCRETAAAFGLPVDLDDRWAEIEYGEWEGRRFGELPASDWERWRLDPSWSPPGGESLTAVGHRVRAAIDDLAAEIEGRDVVVVSHVSPIKAALAWALGAGDELAWRIHLAVGSVCRVAVRPFGPVVLSINEINGTS